jgi:hypothetical protein
MLEITVNMEQPQYGPTMMRSHIQAAAWIWRTYIDIMSKYNINLDDYIRNNIYFNVEHFKFAENETNLVIWKN